VEKGVIASFRDVDPYSRAIKVRSTRSTRLCAYTCETVTVYVLPYLLLFPSNSYKQNLRDLDVTMGIERFLMGSQIDSEFLLSFFNVFYEVDCHFAMVIRS